MGQYVRFDSTKASLLHGDFSDSTQLHVGSSNGIGNRVVASVAAHKKLIALIIIFVLITTTMIIVFITVSNTEHPILTTQELEALKLNSLISNIQDEYIEAIRPDISDAALLEVIDLLRLHNTKKDVQHPDLKPLTTDQNVLQMYKNQLSTELSNLTESFKRERSSRMETKLAETILVMELMVQLHFVDLQEEVYQKGTKSKFLEYHELERKRILSEFEETTIPIRQKSSVYDNLKLLLESSLNQVYKQVDDEWNLKIEKASEHLRKAYRDEYQLKIGKYNSSSELIPPEMSWEFHESVANNVFSKNRDNLGLPASSPRVHSDLKLFLDQLYLKKVTENAVIGIDFGERYALSSVLYLQGNPQIIPHFDRSGEIYNSTACFIGLEDYDGWVGQCAENVLISSVEATPIIYDLRMLLNSWEWNRKYLETRPGYFTWNYTVYSGTRTEPPSVSVSREGSHYSATLIVSKLLRQLLQNAEKFLSSPVKKCVITVPWYFSKQQKTLLSEAGLTAGFTNVTFLEDYAAAAIALQKVTESWSSEKKVLYIDFAARHWYFYVIKGSQTDFEILKWDWFIGGYHLSDNLANYCIQQFTQVENVRLNDLQKDGRLRNRRLFESCVNAIQSLSTATTTAVVVTDFFAGKNLSVNITRNKFEELNVLQFNKISEFISNILRLANVQKQQVDEVILAGDYSGIPKVQEIVENNFPERNTRISSIRPEEVIVYGAAVKGAILAANEIKLMNLTIE